MKPMIALSVVAVLATLALGTTAACRRRTFPCAGGDEMDMVVQQHEAAGMHHREAAKLEAKEDLGATALRTVGGGMRSHSESASVSRTGVQEMQSSPTTCAATAPSGAGWSARGCPATPP